MSTSCNYEKIKGTFTSSDGENAVPYYIYIPSGNPFAVLQISHGMCEYIERYEKEGFISLLCDAGIVVCGNDHIGHGPGTSLENLGYFTDYEVLTSDLHILNGIVKKRYPSLPYVLFGQGMGSFIARDYATKFDDIDGAVFSATTAGDKPLGATKFLADTICKLKGAKHRSKLLDKLTFGSYNKGFEIENDTVSYLTSDPSVRQRYRNDKYCSYKFTSAAMRELAKLLIAISCAEWVEKTPISLPVLIVSGEKDPLADGGEGIKTLYAALEDHEMNELKMKLYPEGRHEIFYDACRKEAMSDLIEWIKEVADGVVACRSYNSIPFGKVDFS